MSRLLLHPPPPPGPKGELLQKSKPDQRCAALGSCTCSMRTTQHTRTGRTHARTHAHTHTQHARTHAPPFNQDRLPPAAQRQNMLFSFVCVHSLLCVRSLCTGLVLMMHARTPRPSSRHNTSQHNTSQHNTDGFCWYPWLHPGNTDTDALLGA